MQTNKTISKDSELYKAGQELINAASNYWKEYQKEIGGAAVVWLSDESGHLIVFTREEYRNTIMHNIQVNKLFNESFMSRVFKVEK